MIKQKYKIGQKVLVRKDATSNPKFNRYGSEVFAYSVCTIKRGHFSEGDNEWTYLTNNTNWVHEEFFFVPPNRLGGKIL